MHVNHVGTEAASADLEATSKGLEFQEAGPEEGVESEATNFSQPEGKPQCN